MKYDQCPLCGKNKWQNYFDNEKVTLVQCMTCKLVFNPQPSIFGWDQAESLYGKQNLYHRRKIKDMLEQIAIDRYRQIEKFLPHTGKMLEIGGGTGEFCAYARLRGWDVEMLELSESFTKEAAERYDIKVRREMFTSTCSQEQSLDVICLFHVFEHLPDPNTILKTAYDLLKPQGLLVLILPNIRSFTDRMLGENNSEIIREDHLFHYSEFTISAMLSKHQFVTCAIYTMEPAHHIWTTLYSILARKKQSLGVEILKNNLVQLSRWSRIPYRLGQLCAPFTYTYRRIVERYGLGHEILYVGKKNE